MHTASQKITYENDNRSAGDGRKGTPLNGPDLGRRGRTFEMNFEPGELATQKGGKIFYCIKIVTCKIIS